MIMGEVCGCAVKANSLDHEQNFKQTITNSVVTVLDSDWDQVLP